MMDAVRQFVWDNRTRLFEPTEMPAEPQGISLSLFHHGNADEWSKQLSLATYRDKLICIVKTVRSPQYNDRLIREYTSQQQVAAEETPFRVPKVLCTGYVGERLLYAEEVIDGIALSSQQGRDALDAIWSYHCRIAPGEDIPIATAVTAVQAAMAPELLEKHGDSLAELTQPLRRAESHGDVTTRNLLRDKEEKLVLIDWQRAGERPFWGIDLCHYLARFRGATTRSAFAAALAMERAGRADPGRTEHLEEVFVLDRALDALEKTDFPAYQRVVRGIAEAS